MLRLWMIVPFFLAALTCGLEDPLKPPVAKKVPKTMEMHGQQRVDDYFWLREKDSPAVLGYLEAENAYTAAVLKPTEQLQEKLYKEILGRIKQTDLTAPYRRGEWWYYTRTVEGSQYPIHCRKKGSLNGPEEILLDLNELAKGEKYLGLGDMAISDDGNLLAYTVDTTGFRVYTLKVKDLRTGNHLPDTLENVSFVEWDARGEHLFYVTDDPTTKRPYRLFRHALGTDPKADTLVYEEKDELFNLGLGRTLDRKYLIVGTFSFESTQCWFVPTAEPLTAPRLIWPVEDRHRYMIAGHRDGQFYVLTNKNAKNFSLVAVPVGAPTEITEVVAHRPEVLLEGATVFAHHVVLSERQEGLDRLVVRPLAGGSEQVIRMPEPTYTLSSAVNAEFDVKTFRYGYSSYVTPTSVFEYDMEKQASTLIKQQEVLGGFDRSLYRSERIWATSHDGIKVPISLVYRIDKMKKDGSNPCWLHGYGSYGYGATINFSVAHLSMLDRGFVVADAHIRGGNDLGELWHEDGKLMKKKNTFLDFIACGQHLCRERFTSADKLVIEGGSAGGLLIGATINMAPPGFCRIAILDVPFVDVVNTICDPSLPLTTQEYLEWGDPNEKEAFEYIKSYCPYTNLAARPYPAVFVFTSYNDSQVMYWEPAKYVAKLRALKTDANVALFKCNMAAGHSGASGRYDAIKDVALTQAFVLWQLGMIE